MHNFIFLHRELEKLNFFCDAVQVFLRFD